MCDCNKAIQCPSCNAVIENKWVVIKSEKVQEKKPEIVIKKKSMPAVKAPAPIIKEVTVEVLREVPVIPSYLKKIADNWAASKLPSPWTGLHWVAKESVINKSEDYDLIHYLLKTETTRAVQVACSKRLTVLENKRMTPVPVPPKAVTPSTPKVTTPGKTSALKTVTDCDRRSILIAMLGEWKKISKQDLAKKLGLNLNQVMSVCAWTQKTLGDVDYLVKYVPEWLGSNTNIDALLEKEFQK